MIDLSSGIKLKREGKLEEALAFYEKAERFDPDNRQVFNAKGKVLYLLGREEEAVDNYLVYLALSLKEAERSGAEPFDSGGTDSLLQIYYPEDLTELVERARHVHPSAPYLLREPQVLNHLGHALLDFSSDLPADLAEALDAYRRSLMGGEGDSAENAPAYTGVGLDFILDNFSVLLTYLR